LKNLVITVAVLLLLGFSYLYLLTPSTLNYEETAVIKGNSAALIRNLASNSHVEQWWPQKSGTAGERAHRFNNSKYSFIVSDPTMVVAKIVQTRDSIRSQMFFLDNAAGEVRVIWRLTYKLPLAIIARVKKLGEATQIRKDVRLLLNRFQAYYASPGALYGFKLHISKVRDTTFLAVFQTEDSYPDQSEVYHLADSLMEYGLAKNLKRFGAPMLNVQKVNEGRFLVEVAVPVDTVFESSGPFHFKRLPPHGDLLIVNVTGGSANANCALTQALNYIADNHRTLAALPFFSLITDRRKEKDSTRWLTQVICPVR